MNASLRRDPEEAQRKLASRDFAAPQDRTNSSGATADVAVIKNKLNGGGSAADLAAEAYRVCQVNDELRKQLNAVDYQKKRYAVMEDALKEMRNERLQMRSVLERAWGILEKAPCVQVPQDLKTAYERLLDPDGHD